MHAQSLANRIYNLLEQKGWEAIRNDDYFIDPYLGHSQKDNRKGLSLIARPSKEAIQSWEQFIQSHPSPIELICYRGDQLHLTVLSIVSCHKNFELDPDQSAQYDQIIRQSLSGSKKMKIHWCGLIPTPQAIIVKGIPLDDHILHIRNSIRAAFQAKSFLKQDIDQRYRQESAHMSVGRYNRSVQNEKHLNQWLHLAGQVDLGMDTIKSLHLVKNDWYMTTNKIENLATFTLL